MTTRNRPSSDELKKQSESFWNPPTLEELIAEQGVKPIESLEQFVIPELANEDIDELLAILDEIRHG